MLKETSMPIDKNNWYYEEKKGICVVHQVCDKSGTVIRTDQFYIPWKRLLESVRRKYPKEKEFVGNYFWLRLLKEAL